MSNHREPSWSPYQLAIFREIAEGKGHMVVQARAGSGKTSTIMEAMNYIPEGLTALLCAFNKDIASELEHRVPKDVGADIMVSTLHAFGFRAVKNRFGRGTKVDGHKVSNLVRAKLGNLFETMDRRRAMERAVSLAKANMLDTSSTEALDFLIDAYGLDAGADEKDRRDFVRDTLEVLRMSRDPFTEAIPEDEDAGWKSEKWNVVQTTMGTIDFDDMIWLPVVHNLPVEQFDRVFVDETQDLNVCQIELALKACRKNGRICAVGDDRQAIYQFRGADANALTNVIERLNARVLPLSVSYRCAKKIVEVAQKMVPDFEWDSEAEDGTVVEVNKNYMYDAAQPGDFILSRTNAPLVGLCLSFLRENRRANIQGRDIGTKLSSFVKKSKTRTVPQLRTYVADWRVTEIKRLTTKSPPRDTQQTEDQADTILALCDGMETVAQVIARIEGLFSDDSTANRIVLSTTHKAKGLERDRVFVLRETYMRRGKVSIEEENLLYVAVTRARRHLFLVKGEAVGGDVR